MPDFSSAAVIGTGMMGPGIALTLGLGGVRTVLCSRSAEGVERGLASARRMAGALASSSLLEQEESRAALERITGSTDFSRSVAAAGLVVESAPENLSFKQELFARIEALANSEAVLASNTSGLSITAIASRCTRPERVLTTHFWNPPHLMPLVEVVQGERTSPAVAEAVRDLLSRCGKTPVVVRKDRPGQLGNRLQMALVREAIHIVAEGIATAEDVDLVAKTSFGLRMPVYGILEHQDIVGLDMTSGIVDYVTRDLLNEPGAPPLMREKVAAGEYGVKSGRGFYDWSAKDAEAVKALRDRFLLFFLKAQRNGFTS